MTMAEKRRVPTIQEAAEQLERGIIDDSILGMTDDELLEQLAPFSRHRSDDDGPAGRRSA